MPRQNKTKLHRYTEMAMRALGKKFPDITYLPLQTRGPRVVTINPRTAEEDTQRVIEADPVGFLIAIMQGQPLLNVGAEPKTAVKPKGSARVYLEEVGEARVFVEWVMPTVADRERVAQFLAREFISKKNIGRPGAPEEEKPDDGFADLMKLRARQMDDAEREEGEGEA